MIQKYLWLLSLSPDKLDMKQIDSVLEQWKSFHGALFLIDDGVHMQRYFSARKNSIKANLFICNYSCMIRNMPVEGVFTPSGLFTLSNLINQTQTIICDDEKLID